MAKFICDMKYKVRWFHENNIQQNVASFLDNDYNTLHEKVFENYSEINQELWIGIVKRLILTILQNSQKYEKLFIQYVGNPK